METVETIEAASCEYRSALEEIRTPPVGNKNIPLHREAGYWVGDYCTGCNRNRHATLSMDIIT